MLSVQSNYKTVIENVRAAEKKYGREPGSVKVLAVSKKQSLPKIKTIAELGHKDVGENHVQEALAKIQRLKSLDLTWHFIGTIQSNKATAIAKYFSWVHSIDRAKVAMLLSEHRPADLEPINFCIEVNIDGESSKSGVRLDELPILASVVSELPNLRLRGLMCIPELREYVEEQREPFAKMREAFDDLNAKGFNLDTLSMGMTDDYEAAIAEGATIVRIGTAVFGERI